MNDCAWKQGTRDPKYPKVAKVVDTKKVVFVEVPKIKEKKLDKSNKNSKLKTMRLENYSIQKIKEFASMRHVNYAALRGLLEDIGLEFPKRGLKTMERYHHARADYKYLTSIDEHTGEMILYNLTKDKPSSLSVDHPAVLDGWPDDY